MMSLRKGAAPLPRVAWWPVEDQPEQKSREQWPTAE
jgi:hypothetical protein